MAIPSTPKNAQIQQANAQILVSADPSAGATSYTFQRSVDGLNFTTIGTAAVPELVDSSISLSTMYYYQVAAVNASGTSPYTDSLQMVAATQGEMSLYELRLRSQQKADRVDSKFVTQSEWDFFINQALFELYDLLITCFQDYYVATPVSFTTDGSTYLYPLPNGQLSFVDPSGNSIVAKPFYKLMGVDLAVNTSNNGWVTIKKYMFIDRNNFIYPNTASTIYGVFNLRYRMIGIDKIEFIPVPSGNQQIRLWYIPRMDMLLRESDTSSMGISGWLSYVIARAAKYALDKEESDTSKIDQELLFLKKRIEESATDRDVGQPDTISDTRASSPWSMNGPFPEFKGGW